MEELFDKELQSMVKFTDARAAINEGAKKNATLQKKAAQQQEKKAHRSEEEAADGEWQPIKGEPTYMERLQACAKGCALFGGLSILLFYWQQTGQMESSAAVPSMCVCALLAGVSVGRHWKWK